MRLLNVNTMNLEEYFGAQIPKYAILSHCWGEGEVTFQDMNSSKWQHMPGARKTNYASSQCRRDGLEHLWIDTFCIDKSSSAELSEAINSMYSWYEKSEICYAYLEDLFRRTQSGSLQTDSDLLGGRWFTRGWTLQELIAPSKINFYDVCWQLIGTKKTLAGRLSSITAIPSEVLEDASKRMFSSVARRMTWAARRQTTRMEDIAYSLFGIFGVNMPLLYGEGERAFVRLQEEILKEVDDHSIFAWGLLKDSDTNLESSYGVLAVSPAAFAGSESVIPIPSGKSESQPSSMTNKGLRIEVPLLNRAITENLSHPVALLNCQFEMDFSGQLGIFLNKTSDNSIFTRWGRGGVKKISITEAQQARVELIYISKHSIQESPSRKDACIVRCDSIYNHGFHILHIGPKPSHNLWNPQTSTLQIAADQFEVGSKTYSRDPSFATISFYNEETNAGFAVAIQIYHSMRANAFVKIQPKPEGMAKDRWLSGWKRYASTSSNSRDETAPGWKDFDSQKIRSKQWYNFSAKVVRENILNQVVYVLSVTMEASNRKEDPIADEATEPDVLVGPRSELRYRN
jgi:hypothetical protein